MLIDSFLYSTIRKDDETILFKLKDEMVAISGRPQLEFVKDYFAQYKKFPDIATVEAKFAITLTPSTESPDYWFTELVEKYKERVAETAIVDAAKDKSNAISIMQKAIVDHNTDSSADVYDYNQGADRANEYKARKGTGGITYLSCGADELNAFSLGFKRTDLWTIGGREGLGKTWYLLRMAAWLDIMMIHTNNNRNILIVSGEMGKEEIGERLDAIKCELSYARLSRGDLSAGEERKYLRFLQGFTSNIKIVDSFDNLKDIEYLQSIYRPAITLIDGSHLLSASYEWTDIAQVTAGMKRMARNGKSPVVNTTHLKSERGKSAEGGDLDDFAYTKGYTRDSDIAGVMYASDMMEVENKIGIDFVKVRRGDKCRIIYENDYDTCTTKVAQSLVGSQIAAAKNSSNSGAPTGVASGTGNIRGGNQKSGLFP